MRRRTTYWLSSVILLWVLQVTPGFGQVSNKPGTATQVPGATGTVAPIPASYITNGQSSLINYVRERDAMGRITDTILFANAGYIDVRQTTQYVDGLGRPLQTVAQQATPGNSPADLVTPVIYDQFGRVTEKYLPYIASAGNTTDGNFKQDPFTDQANFYQNIYPAQQPAYTGEQVFYGQTNFEASPLNRVLQTLAPGNSWAGSGVGISQQYLTSTSADSVEIWNITNDTLTYVDNDLTTNIPVSGGYYAAGRLYKNVTVDEQGHAVVEYKDMDGLVVLKKVQIGTVATDYSGYSGWLSTYYVYDNLNELRFVLSPKATGIAYGNSWNLSSDTTTINELCFRYEYDSRRRMMAKKVPGAGWTYMIYDSRDRPVFTQDANMRVRNQWLTTIYDALNRPTTTGMITYSGNPNQLELYVTENTASSAPGTITVSGTSPNNIPQALDLTGVEDADFQAQNTITLDNGFSTPDNVNFTAEIVTSGSGSGAPFTNTLNVVDNPIPSGINLIPLTMTFYDDYSNMPDKQYSTTYSSLLDAGTNQHVETIPTGSAQQAVQTIGQITGTRVHVIENPNDLTQGNWLETATFYDDRLRVTQTQGDNYKGGQDTSVNLYNFTGIVLTTYLAHGNPQASFNNNTRVKTNMNLDAENRVMQVYTTVNDTSKRLVAQHNYDQLGQLMQKQLGQLPDNSFLETQDLTYNIRGWLKGINKDYANNDNSHGADNRWFGMELSYDWGFGTNSLNGNISGNKWRSKGDGQLRAYGFGYDDANRFLFGDFNQYSGSGWDRSAGIDFSAIMGNGTDPTTAYDPNGNILAMQQEAWQLGGSRLIDSLNYTYYTHSNKLQNVIDGDNNPTTSLGDFRTSSLSPYANSKTSAAVDYRYDGNGNLLTDLNKDIGSQTANGIIYNHLNLPWQISFRSATGTKGTITYIYDADGNKLKKTTLDSAGNLETVTTYIGPFQYQATAPLTGTGSGNLVDTLKFFAHSEGRVRVENDTIGGQTLASYKYDYFLKDHLGNTRLVLTDEQQSDMYPAATMEVRDSASENLYYMNLDSTRSSLPPGYPTDTTTNPNNYVAKVSGSSSGPVIGPGIVLKVMAGDEFSIRVSSWYRLNGTTPGTPVNPLTDILAHLIAGMAGIPNPENPGLTALQNNSPVLSSNVLNFLQDTGTTINSSKPHAFVNWILLDNQYHYVAASSGFSQVGNDQELHLTTLTNLPVTSSGYLYIYTSNETPNVDVFFDNLQVTHTRGPLLEEDHYYPFGLTMAGISDKALKSNYAENKYRYNKGSELQNKEFSDGSGLEIYETHLRELDPQLGRWWQVDSKTDQDYESVSPYSSMNNDPIRFNDANGDEGEGCCEILQTLWDNEVRGFQRFGAAVKDAINTAGDNFKKRWAAGATFPQQLAANPMSAVTGVKGVPIEVPGAAAAGDIVRGAEEVKAIETTNTATGTLDNPTAETKGSNIQANAAKGKAYEKTAKAELEAAGNTNVQPQITIKADNGVKTVMDFGSFNPDGTINLTEAKSSPTAPLTDNQAAAHPSIEASGGTVVGKGKPGFEGGTRIPPTKVNVKRPGN